MRNVFVDQERNTRSVVMKEKITIRKNETKLSIKIESNKRLIYSIKCINIIHFQHCLYSIIQKLKGKEIENSIFNT